MKIFYDVNLYIANKEQGLPMIKGDKLSNEIKVYIKTSDYSSYASAYPVFDFIRADNRHIGPVSSETNGTETIDSVEYKYYSYTLDSTVCKITGELQISISWIYGSSGDQKKVTTQVTTQVMKSTVVGEDDNILILGDNVDEIVTNFNTIIASYQNTMANVLTKGCLKDVKTSDSTESVYSVKGANATFLNKEDAANTYLSNATAANTYIAKANAATKLEFNTLLAKVNAMLQDAPDALDTFKELADKIAAFEDEHEDFDSAFALLETVLQTDDTTTAVNYTFVSNKDMTYKASNISSIVLNIPSTISHGFYSTVNFKITEDPDFSVINNSTYPIKYVKGGITLSTLTFNDDTTVRLFCECDDINVYIYMQEI